MSSRSIQALPVDLFHLLSAELCERLDFSTLFSLAVSSKHLANSGAIAALYRISHQSPVKGGGSEALSLAEQELVVQRWSILWRTIALSAFGRTLFPYCRYMRSLDLPDLGNLLEDDKFRGKISKHFFTSELAKLHYVQEISTNRRRVTRLDTKRIIAAIGEEITKNATLLESVAEPMNSDVLSSVLPQWAPRLANLRSLELFDGKVLADETVKNLLHSHCPHLSVVRIYQSSNEHSDRDLAAFVSGMQDNSLTYFENISNCGIGPETCLALNGHGKSLRTLKLALTEEGVLALALLRGCTSLQQLRLDAIMGSIDLEATQNDVYLEIIEWLKNCRGIEEMSFRNFASAPSLSLPILLNEESSLQCLEITGIEPSLYVVKDHHDFHQALSTQKHLEQLTLYANPDPVTGDDNEVLINSFCKLENLRVLWLARISDYFTDEHISLLAQHLHNLEEFVIGGYGISDSVWSSLAGLKYLKTITLNGLTNFSFRGIADFIDQLGEDNFGMNLSIDMADPDSALSQEEQDSLRDSIADRVNGRFEYQLLRDPNMSEFDSEDSE